MNSVLLKVRGNMSHPFTHPSAKPLLRRVAQLFEAPDTFILRDSNIVFVCGGPMDRSSMRSRFCEYAKTDLKILRVFLAEDAEKDYVSHDNPDFHNVGEFEKIIADVSDCLMIFPESPGSYAELGFFSAHEQLRKKILVVNDFTLQGEDSFISRGPVELIDKYSHFKPTIQMQFNADVDFTMVRQRLEKRISGSKRRRFESIAYNDLATKDKLFIVFAFVELLISISFEGLEYAFKSVFGHSNREDLKHLLSILVAAKLVDRKGAVNDHFSAVVGAQPFIEFESLNKPEFRLLVLNFYQQEFPDLAALCVEATT